MNPLTQLDISKNLEALTPGDWINFRYGFSRLDWYVMRNHPQQKCVELNTPRWLVSSSQLFTYAELEDRKQSAQIVYLGRSRKRWWRFLTLMFIDCTPLYSKPS